MSGCNKADGSVCLQQRNLQAQVAAASVAHATVGCVDFSLFQHSNLIKSWLRVLTVAKSLLSKLAPSRISRLTTSCRLEDLLDF